MKQPLHAQDLAHTRCENPDCPDRDHPIYITPRCHPGEGVDVGVDRERNVLIVQCHVCKTPIAEIAVAVATTH